MPQPHVIRLRGPWECQPLERFDASADLPAAARVQAPCDWAELLGHEFLGRVRYTRRFNRPTNLDPHERVWLIIDGVDHHGLVTLNGTPLGQVAGCARPARFDVTELLQSHNTLEVEVSLDRETFHDSSLRGQRAGQSGGLVGEVRLEIE
jgi:beta-galactosidase/beta-glucuronidase